MRKNNALKIASIYIGTVIGAGFASGQEMICFFTKHGVHGIYGVVLTTILFSMIGSFILLKVYKHKVNSYHDWIQSTFGRSIGTIIDGFLSLLLFSLYCVMLAGSGALFEEFFGCRKEIGVILMSLTTFFTFIFSMRGLSFVNIILVPLLLLGIIGIGSLVLLKNYPLTNEVHIPLYTIRDNWIISCLLYVSYNSISAGMILSAMYPLLDSKKVAIGGGVLGGIGLGLMLFFLFLPTLILYSEIQGVEIPMMTIALKFGDHFQFAYGFLLWFAMLTTAIGNGFVFIQRIEERWKNHHLLVCMIFCICTVPLAQFGFKTLVHTLYPLFGYMGILFILVACFRKLKER